MNKSMKSRSEDQLASERWEDEGGPVMTSVQRKANLMVKKFNYYGSEDNKLTLLPPFEHKEPLDDDCGLPNDPIYSNYSKYLWTSHTKSGGVQIRGLDDTKPSDRH
jgi:hypothetical protein